MEPHSLSHGLRLRSEPQDWLWAPRDASSIKASCGRRGPGRGIPRGEPPDVASPDRWPVQHYHDGVLNDKGLFRLRGRWPRRATLARHEPSLLHGGMLGEFTGAAVYAKPAAPPAGH
jgi:hypothetical protein